MRALNNALGIALDAAAPDKEKWFAGYYAFHASYNRSKDVELAIAAALDAAAPDKEEWMMGYQRFNANYNIPWWKRVLSPIKVRPTNSNGSRRWI